MRLCCGSPDSGRNKNRRKFSGRISLGIVQKVFSEKASAIARMRQKCVRNASNMRQKCVKMGLLLLGKEERPKCVRNPSKKKNSSHFGCNSSPGLGWGDCTWVLWIHLSFLLGLLGQAYARRLACPSGKGPASRLATIYHTLALSAGADFARRLSVPGAVSSNGRLDSSEQTAQHTTKMDGGPRATRAPRRNGLDAQPSFSPVPGIEGQRQGQRTGQTQTQTTGSLPGSTSPVNHSFGLLRGSRQATTQPETKRGAGHPDIDRDQMSEMPGIQLDQQRAVPFPARHP